MLQGVGSSGSGIYSYNTSCTNLTIRNGSINNWGGSGVAIFPAMNCLLEGLNVSSNSGHGIAVGGYGVIRNCNSSLNAGDGFNGDAALATAS
ncbi:MAG: right-handed parallel beta-helix repeat-containing protein [Limisphaerales bacterium]